MTREQDLLRSARDGSRCAFDELRASLEPDVRRFVVRLVGNSGAIDDVIQDVFLSLYQNLERIDPDTNPRPYLFRIARNRCYDELRSKGRFKTVPLDQPAGGLTPADSLPDPAPTPDAAFHHLLMMSEVQQAIESLPELQRETLILYAEEGLTLVEVAEATGAELGTVKSRIHNARRNLLRRITPETRAGLGLEGENDNGK